MCGGVDLINRGPCGVSRKLIRLNFESTIHLARAASQLLYLIINILRGDVLFSQLEVFCRQLLCVCIGSRGSPDAAVCAR